MRPTELCIRVLECLRIFVPECLCVCVLAWVRIALVDVGGWKGYVDVIPC